MNRKIDTSNYLGLSLLVLLLGIGSASAQALLPNGQQQFTDSNGAPLAGGSVYFYTPSTTTPKTTWQDIEETTPNTNPVILNSAGRATIWGTGAYREIVYDGFGNLIWDQTTYGVNTATASTTGFGLLTVLPGGTTTDLGTVLTNNVLLTGASTISSFGSSASTAGPVFLVRFTGVNTLVYNSTSMILPGGANIQTATGDTGIFVYLGSGNWYCYQYQAEANSPLATGFGAQSALASAGVTVLSASSHNILISGTTTITSFSNVARLAEPVYLLQFSGALTLTNNATSMILPGGANIQTAAGDSALALYLGSSNWQILEFWPKLVGPFPAGLHSTTYNSNGSHAFTIPPAATSSTVFELICQAPGGGGGSNQGGSGGGGGGGGAGAYADVMVTGFSAGGTLTVTVGGVGGVGSGAVGTPGGDGNGPTKYTWSGVDFLSCGQGLGGASGGAGVNLGGNGGTVSTNFSGAGLTATNTVASMSGIAGGHGKYEGSNIGVGGPGGGTVLGQGGPPTFSVTTTFSTGLAGNGYGAGSAGGTSGDGSQSNAQNGAPGVAIIRWVI